MADKKVTVNLPEDQVQFLKDLMAKENITFTEALRRAINSERFFVQQERSGLKVLVEDQDKQIREVVRK